MKTILCFGDSNTYGYIPGSGERYPRDVRWPGRLQKLLGEGYYVVEEGLNGRTTAFGDDIEPYRKGLDYILPCVMSHSPVDLIIIMLGTNDIKERYHVCAEEIGYGMEEVVMKITGYFQFREQKPQIMIVAPVPIGNTDSAEFTAQSIEKSRRLAPIYQELAERFGCHFLNAADYVKGLGCDKIHYDPQHHAALCEGIWNRVKEILK